MILGIPKKALTIIATLVGLLLLYSMGMDKRSAGASGGSPTGCKVAVTADVLNARSAPVATAGIVGKYNKDAQIDAQPVVQDGFRKIADNKWAKTEFLTPSPDRTAAEPPAKRLSIRTRRRVLPQPR